ncbi:hypothetical protein SAMN04487980_1002211 [Streptomyces sp. cf124]|nr:hypothetical protein SAMN04487980_1002211 [Streptomyces sp. cf124]
MDNPVQGEPIGEKWYATLRTHDASQTATVCREPLRHPGGPAGEGAR